MAAPGSSAELAQPKFARSDQHKDVKEAQQLIAPTPSSAVEINIE